MKLDPITFEVVNNALVGAAEQMAATILRTSYSTVIREMLDYSTAGDKIVSVCESVYLGATIPGRIDLDMLWMRD